MAARLGEFVLVACLVEVTPGPNMAYLATLTMAEGRRTGLIAVAGVACGLALVGLAAVFGLATLVETVPSLYEVLRYGGAAFLLYLAAESVFAVERSADAPEWRSVFVRALLTNLLNPKAAIFYVAVLPVFTDEARGSVALQTLLLAAIYVTLATLVHVSIVLFADRLRPYLVVGPWEVVVRRSLAGLLALVALWFFIGTRH